MHSFIHFMSCRSIHSCFLSFTHTFVSSHKQTFISFHFMSGIGSFFIFSATHSIFFIHSFSIERSFIHSCLSFRHSIHSFIHSVSHSFSHSVIQSFRYSDIQSFSHSASQSSVIQSVSHSLIHSVLHSNVRSINQRYIHVVTCAYFLTCHFIGISITNCPFIDAPRNLKIVLILHRHSYKPLISYTHFLSKLPPGAAAHQIWYGVLSLHNPEKKIRTNGWRTNTAHSMMLDKVAF